MAMAALAAGAIVLAARADAHPHVWVTMTEEVLYAPDGAITGLRHAWTFDDMFSSFAIEGVEHKKDSGFTREDLAPLAQVNVDSLKEYAYFTSAKVDGKRNSVAFLDPVDYFLDYDPTSTVLTLHFTLPLKKPIKAKAVVFEIYDPEFFIDFGFAEGDSTKLVGAPAGCQAAVEKPHDDNFVTSLRLDKSFTMSEANAGMGANFANRIAITCP
jgi:ABC-type uncharacterized transport system substrate-binding protein